MIFSAIILVDDQIIIKFKSETLIYDLQIKSHQIQPDLRIIICPIIIQYLISYCSAMQPSNLEVEPNIKQLQFESSFSSSSSSECSMLNLSDIVSLCDKDVRLDFTYVKLMFKGVVNKLNQLELAQTIKDQNLRISGEEEDFNQNTNQNPKLRNKKDKAKNKESSDDDNSEMVMNIKEKRVSEVEKKSKSIKKQKQQKVPQHVDKKKSEKKDKNKSKQKLFARQQLLSQQSRVYSDIQIEKKVIQLQKQAIKIKSLLSALKHKVHETNLKEGQQLQHLLNLEAEKDDDYIVSVNTKTQKFEGRDPKQYFEINNSFQNKFQLSIIDKKFGVQYIGPDNQQSALYLSKKKFDQKPEYSIRIIKTKFNHLKFGLTNAKCLNNQNGEQIENKQWIFYDGKNGNVFENGNEIKQEGVGVGENDVVTVKIQKEKKNYEIEWIVNGIVRATHSSQKLLNQNVEWLPCIIFANSGDLIKIR